MDQSSLMREADVFLLVLDEDAIASIYSSLNEDSSAAGTVNVSWEIPRSWERDNADYSTRLPCMRLTIISHHVMRIVLIIIYTHDDYPLVEYDTIVHDI